MHNKVILVEVKIYNDTSYYLEASSRLLLEVFYYKELTGYQAYRSDNIVFLIKDLRVLDNGTVYKGSDTLCINIDTSKVYFLTNYCKGYDMVNVDSITLHKYYEACIEEYKEYHPLECLFCNIKRYQKYFKMSCVFSDKR